MSQAQDSYREQLEAYLNQQVTCPACGKTMTMRDWPTVPSSGKPKKTCCRTTGWDKVQQYEERKKQVGEETWFLCRTCLEHKPETEFNKSKHLVRSECKACHAEKYKDYVSPTAKKAREEARKRKILRDNEVIKCKACGKEMKRKDWPKQKSGKIADICCTNRSAAHVNRYLARRGKRLCGSCDIVKPLDHFQEFNGKPVSPCRVCRKAINVNKQYDERRKNQIVDSDDGTLVGKNLSGLFIAAKTCPVCFSDMEYEDKTLDHVLPLVKGGGHSLSNAMIMCHSCNSKKKDQDPKGWFKSLSQESQQSVLAYFEQSEHLDKDILL